LKRSTFNVPKMNCPSEEKTIKLAFDGVSSIKKLIFDLSKKKLEVLHENPKEEVLSVLMPLGFGASLVESHDVSEMEEVLLSSNPENDLEETKALGLVFIINALMFAIELGAGIVAQSMGLIADSLDMFADAAVFGMSLYAVGKAISLKRRAARVSGYLQMALALGAFFEVVRRFIHGSDPEAPVMMIVAAIALVANATCMWLLAKHRNGEVHMQASWIFLTNDVIANASVILAGLLVLVTGSHIPDLVSGAVIGGIVLAGSFKILKAARPT
jgi:Co/Zn/Cd efflux system component